MIKLNLKISVPKKGAMEGFYGIDRKVHSPANLRNLNNKMCGLFEIKQNIVKLQMSLVLVEWNC